MLRKIYYKKYTRDYFFIPLEEGDWVIFQWEKEEFPEYKSKI